MSLCLASGQIISEREHRTVDRCKQASPRPGQLTRSLTCKWAARFPGTSKPLYADFNTKVTKGQLVAQIDPQAFQTQVDQAQAALSSDQSAVLTSGAQVVKAKADLAGTTASEKSVESGLAKDRAGALNAQIQWQRSDTLFSQGIASRQDHDSANAVMDAAEAQVAADQSQIEASKQTIQSAEEGW